MAKKKGPVLYELMRKDHAEKRCLPDQDEASQQSPPAETPQEAPAQDAAVEPPTSRMDAPQDDNDGMVFHLTRPQAAIAAAVAIVALVIFGLIGLRAGKQSGSTGSAVSQQPAGQTTGKPADEDPSQPLALLLPEPGSDPKPDAPVKLGPKTEDAAQAAGTADTAEAPGQNRQVAPQTALLTKGDTRKAGLNYLVIQIIPDRPEAAEHAAEVRKFLAAKGIRTIQVPGAAGGLKILSERGFNFESTDDKDKLERLTDAVKKAGKDYATAKGPGRYDFRAPYAEKYKGK